MLGRKIEWDEKSLASSVLTDKFMWGDLHHSNKTLVARITRTDGRSIWLSAMNVSGGRKVSILSATLSPLKWLGTEKCIRFRGQIINWRQLVGSSERLRYKYSTFFPNKSSAGGRGVRIGGIRRMELVVPLINVTVYAEIEHQTLIYHRKSLVRSRQNTWQNIQHPWRLLDSQACTQKKGQSLLSWKHKHYKYFK